MDHLLRGFDRLIGFFKDVFAFIFVEELTTGWIEGHGDVLASLKAGLPDCLQDQFNGLYIGFERWRKASLIAHGCIVSAFLQHSLQRMKYLCAPLERLGK